MVFTNSRRQVFSFYTVQTEDEDDRARELPLLEISSESAIDIRNEIYKGPLQEYIEECNIFKSLLHILQNIVDGHLPRFVVSSPTVKEIPACKHLEDDVSLFSMIIKYGGIKYSVVNLEDTNNS